MTDYLDLDRQFMPFQDEESWEIRYQSFFSDGFYSCEGWSDLLSHRRTVILAEAGAGKTAEMSERAKALVEAGSPAFCVTVNKLATTPFRDALVSPEDQARFDAWLVGNREGVFFIDSVDQARLSGKSFRDALSRLAKALVGHAARATILVSCRVSDWRATQDRAAFEELLGKPPDVEAPAPPLPEGGDDEALYAPLFRNTRPTDESDENATRPPSYKPHITALAPLSDKQAKRLAEFDGVTDSDAFIAAVRDADADDLVNRPQDLLSLTRLWKDKETIGSKHEILKWSIRQRLRESNLDLSHKDTLSEDQALEGARLIAAALTFGHKRSIAWPLDTPAGGADDLSLNPRDALAGWSGQLQQTLLNRAVFDPATHGRVRFHHRSVQELLCAEWLLALMKAGCPIRRIWKLLAEEKYGTVRLRPALRPVTAWLAQLDERIRALVMPLAPDLLIEDGDPALLTTAVRERLLETFAKIYRGRDDAGIKINIDQIARLADPALGGKIRKLWREASSSGELRELLLRIVWAGKIEACGDIVLAAATGRGRHYERALGARALAEIGTREERRTFADHLITHARSFPKEAFAEALQAVFPSVLSLFELETLIRKHPIDNMKSIHAGLSYGLSEIVQRSQLPDPQGLVQMLHGMASEKPWVENSYGAYSKRFSALRAPMADLCARLIQDADGAPLNRCVAEAARFAGLTSEHSTDFQIGEALKRLSEAVSENEAANRQQFWLAVEAYRAKRGDFSNFHLASMLGELWTVKARDFDWLVTDLKTKTLANDKSVALSAAHAAWFHSGENPDQLRVIREAIVGIKDLEDQSDRTLNPPSPEDSDQESDFKRRMAEINAKREEERRGIKESWRNFRDRLVADPNKLKDGTAINELSDLARWMHHLSRRDTYSLRDWQVLAAPFSPEVAEAARDGFVAYWRTYDPGVEFARKNSMPWLALIALIGLAIESAETPDFAAGCSAQDVARATRLALHEMNGFPDWAPDLWMTNPEISGPILRDEIRWEFSRKPKHGSVHHVVSTLAYCKEPLRSLAAEWVLSEFEETSPATDYTLSIALDMITGAETDFSDRLSLLAAARFKSERGIARRLMWLAIWLGVEADTALDALEIWVRKQKTKANQDALVLALLNTMFDHGTYRFGEAYRDFARFDSVVRLLSIAYAHVRREDDNEHEGPFSPDARDNAEYARGNLLGILFDTPGEATYRALMSMSETPEHAISSERLRVLADRRAMADADLGPWGPAEVAAFATVYEKPPATLADLHDVVLDRLWDIEDGMRVGRFSNKAALRQDHLERADERIVQLGIAEQLSLRAKGVYSLEREPELESFDEPDISVQRAGIDEPLPVEIKVADSWSFAKLCRAISGQLIGQYMKPRAAMHGHLVITYHGKKRTWRPGQGKPTLEFPELVLALQKEADHFSQADADVTRVTVTGIDLTDRDD